MMQFLSKEFDQTCTEATGLTDTDGGPLRELGLWEADIKAIIKDSGPGEGERDHDEDEFTFSDLTQRRLLAIVLNAFPSREVEAEAALAIVRDMRPTREFGGRRGA